MGSNVRSASPLLQIGVFLVGWLLVLPWAVHHGAVGVLAYLLVGAAGVWAAEWYSGPGDRLNVAENKYLVFVAWPLYAAIAGVRAAIEVVSTPETVKEPASAAVPTPPVAEVPVPAPAAPVAAPVATAPPPAAAPAPVKAAPPPPAAEAPVPALAAPVAAPVATAPPPAAAPVAARPAAVAAPAPKKAAAPVAPRAPAPGPSTGNHRPGGGKSKSRHK
jgi:hypothetical protein